MKLRRAFAADALELWDEWQFAATEATLKLRIWCTAPAETKAQAHTTYVAALDREEQAARLLAHRLRPAADKGALTWTPQDWA
jgi:hypothetical protein